MLKQNHSNYKRHCSTKDKCRAGLKRNKLINVLLMAMLIGLWSSAHPAVSKETADPPVNETSELGEEVKIAGFSLRPPKLFVAQKPIEIAGLQQQNFGWTDAPVSGSRTLLMLSMNPVLLPIGDVTDQKLLALCNGALLGMNQSGHLETFKCSQPVKEIIGGVSFAHGTWSGVRRVPAHEEEFGFLFVTVLSGDQISLTGISSDRERLKIVEDAAKTFHK
jgi:hypothetical protein